MVFVLDASVTLAWCFEDEASPVGEAALDALAEQAAITPALWPLEVSNVLIVAERRGRLTPAQVARFIALLNDLPIRADRSPVNMTNLVAVGREHNLSAYDASYLMLAEREGLPLATLDKNLAQAAKAAGVPLLAH